MGCRAFYQAFLNKLNKLNKTGIQMVDAIYHMKLKQEMSQTREECPQRNWSSIRHI